MASADVGLLLEYGPTATAHLADGCASNAGYNTPAADSHISKSQSGAGALLRHKVRV